MTKRTLRVLVAVLGIPVAVISAQQPPSSAATPAQKTAGTAAKIRLALSAGPADLAKGAAVAEIDAKGAMHQLRAGTNGWTCLLMAVGDTATEAMCGDKSWSNWGDAYMAKKTPPTPATVGVAYMLRGDRGASNTDPFATGPTPTNHWVVSPAHLMLLLPDPKSLDALPTDPHAGGPWVMWKGTPYAHVMVPTTAMTKMSAAPSKN